MLTPSRDIERLLEIMAALRTPETGCPWDLEQDFATIAPYTIEEAYEVADAIERNDMDDLKLELGDLLLQSVYHAQLAQEQNAFDFGDVVEGITRKMIRRHPHVFGTADVTAEEFSAKGMESGTWERIKAEEKAEAEAVRREKGLPIDEKHSILEDVPVTLPSVQTAIKLQKKASKVGFDWNDTNLVFAKVEEEISELKAEVHTSQQVPDKLEDELGDVLFSLINLARHLNIDPDKALRRTNTKFRNRFAYVERSCADANKELAETSLEEMEQYWQDAKGK